MSDNLVSISVDGRKLQAPAGTMLLPLCLENDIYIPNLCFIDGMEDPPASCRLCLVEIEGETAPVASCRQPIREGMVVCTNSDELLHLRQIAFRLLVSTNDGRCHLCVANHRCDLQKIAQFLHQPLRTKRLCHLVRDYPEVIEEHPDLVYEPKKCVLCGRCVYVCNRLEKGFKLAFAGRGLNTVVSFFGCRQDEATAACRDCLACAEVCPVGALSSLREREKFFARLEKPAR